MSDEGVGPTDVGPVSFSMRLSGGIATLQMFPWLASSAVLLLLTTLVFRGTARRDRSTGRHVVRTGGMAAAGLLALISSVYLLGPIWFGWDAVEGHLFFELAPGARQQAPHLLVVAAAVAAGLLLSRSDVGTRD